MLRRRNQGGDDCVGSCVWAFGAPAKTSVPWPYARGARRVCHRMHRRPGLGALVRSAAFQQVPNRIGLGSEQTSLAAYGQGFDPAGPQLVRGVCQDNPPVGANLSPAQVLTDLGVQVSYTKLVPAWADGLDVTYVSNGSTRVLHLLFGVGLCPPGAPASDRC